MISIGLVGDQGIIGVNHERFFAHRTFAEPQQSAQIEQTKIVKLLIPTLNCVPDGSTSNPSMGKYNICLIDCWLLIICYIISDNFNDVCYNIIYLIVNDKI